MRYRVIVGMADHKKGSKVETEDFQDSLSIEQLVAAGVIKPIVKRIKPIVKTKKRDEE